MQQPPIILNWPKAGHAITLPLEGVKELQLAFSLAEALFELEDGNLVLLAPGNQQTRLILKDYSRHQPDLRLPDGTLINGAELLSSLGFNELETGA